MKLNSRCKYLEDKILQNMDMHTTSLAIDNPLKIDAKTLTISNGHNTVCATLLQ